jgi:hypothetical protein
MRKGIWLGLLILIVSACGQEVDRQALQRSRPRPPIRELPDTQAPSPTVAPTKQSREDLIRARLKRIVEAAQKSREMRNKK